MKNILNEHPIFGSIVFQQKETFSKNLNSEEIFELQRKVFPTSYQQDFRNNENFQGFKIFDLQKKYLGISFITDSKENDQWNRPLIRADIALFTRELFNLIGRDILSIKNYLINCRQKQLEPKEMANNFTSHQIYQNSILVIPEKFEQMVNSLWKEYSSNPEFFYDVVSNALVKEKIVLDGEDSNISPVLQLLFLVLPFSRLTSISLSSICTNPLDVNSENIIISNQFSGGLLSKLVMSGPCIIDTNTKTIKHGQKTRIGELIVNSFFDDTWYTFDRLEQYRILLDMIESYFDRRTVDVTDTNEKILAMRNTINAIYDFKRNLESGLQMSNNTSL